MEDNKVNLEQLIHAYIDSGFKSVSVDEMNVFNEAVIEEAKKSLADKIHKDIKDEIVSELTEDEYSRIYNEVEKRRQKDKANEIKKFIMEGLLLALLVGLLVNQFTDILTYAKNGGGQYLLTFGMVLLLLIIIVPLVFFKFADELSKLT